MLISTILSVVIFLGVIAIMMNRSKTKQIYPATINDCPDFYDLDSNNNCVANLNVWDSSLLETECNIIDFENGSYNSVRYKAPGKKSKSGICAKKLKSQECKITWDGITNNNSIC